MRISRFKGTFKGEYGYWYFIKASDMYEYLKSWRIATVKDGNRVLNGIVFEHPEQGWNNMNIFGHMDVVYRKHWGSQYRYYDYYGGTPHPVHLTDIIH